MFNIALGDLDPPSDYGVGLGSGNAKVDEAAGEGPAGVDPLGEGDGVDVGVGAGVGVGVGGTIFSQ